MLFVQCHFSTCIRMLLMSVTSTFAFCDFYSKLSKQVPQSFIWLLRFYFVTVSSTSWQLLLGFLCDMWVCHESLIIMIIVVLSISCFSSILDICRFYFHYYRCWGTDCLCSTIWSASIWRYTVNFPVVSLEIKI